MLESEIAAAARAGAKLREKVREAGGWARRPPPPECSLAELPEGERAVLDAIAESKWAWVARIYFAAAGRDAELGALEGRGLVECCEPLGGAFPAYAPQGPGATLTPYGARLLRVEMVQHVNPFGVESDRVRWVPMKFDADGNPLRERRSRGVKIPRSFHTLHFDEGEAENVVDGAPGPEYVVDEFNGQPVMCFAGDDGREGAGEAPSAFAASAAVLLGGLGGGRATKGVPIVRDKRLRGKR